MATVDPLKASLISNKSTSSMVMPSFFRHLGIARIGATRTYFISRPALACAPTVAMTGQPSSSAFSRDISTTADAPSEIIEELPAVVTPPFLKAAGIFAKSS